MSGTRIADVGLLIRTHRELRVLLYDALDNPSETRARP